MTSSVQKTSSKIILNECNIRNYSVGKVRYKIHKSLKLKKISLEEWREYLSNNLSYNIKERIQLVEYLNNLEPGRTETKEFKKEQLINNLKSILPEASFFVFIFILFWAFSYYVRKLIIGV
ncbi:MAG: hypothetical protein KDK36_12860 [Leptospiraceae bacterium]|nr:hypothetical protein [Leptospiraceae bacterium]